MLRLMFATVLCVLVLILGCEEQPDKPVVSDNVVSRSQRPLQLIVVDDPQ